LSLEIQILERKDWDHINWFNSVTCHIDGLVVYCV
jgi:hypothetical protein